MQHFIATMIQINLLFNDKHATTHSDIDTNIHIMVELTNHKINSSYNHTVASMTITYATPHTDIDTIYIYSHYHAC